MAAPSLSLSLSLSQAPPAIDIQWDMTAIITFDRWQKRLWEVVQRHRKACEEGWRAVAEVESRELRSAMHRTTKQVSRAIVLCKFHSEYMGWN